LAVAKLISETPDNETEAALRAYETAVKIGVSRASVAKWVASWDNPKVPSADAFERFLRWFQSWTLTRAAMSIDHTKEDSDPSPEKKALMAEIAKLGQSVGDVNRYAVRHKYWFFRPAWEIDSAFWTEHFGDNDPALIISTYLREFFESERKPSPKLMLGEVDVDFLTWLVDLVTPTLAATWVGRDVAPRFRAILLTAFGLEASVEGAISWTHPDFLSVCQKSTPLLRRSLIQYWARTVNFASLPDELAEAAVAQANYLSRCVIGYLVGKYESSKNRKCETVPFLSSSEVLRLADLIFSLEIETNHDALADTVIRVQKAVYDGREKTFAGTFPFSFYDAKEFIGKLASDSGYWLATISYYDGLEYQEINDNFSLVRLLSHDETDAEFRLDRSAEVRYRAFRDAFYSIKSEGFNELAEAWWAFFLGSQAFALLGLGLGLTGSDMAEVSAITLSLPRSPMITKAAAVVVRNEQSRPQTLTTRRCNAIFEPIALSISGAGGATVHDLIISDVQAERFLRKHIGGDTWESLGEQSKRDLIEAEQI
jgi:hypothetical protein